MTKYHIGPTSFLKAGAYEAIEVEHFENDVFITQNDISLFVDTVPEQVIAMDMTQARLLHQILETILNGNAEASKKY